MPIPHAIWYFWTDIKEPLLASTSMQMMREKNPGWEVKALHAGDLDEPPGFHNLLSPQKADWYRLSALADYGGIYVDATIIPLKANVMNLWIDKEFEGLQGFDWPPACFAKYQAIDCPRIMSPVLLAAPANDPFIIAWREELRYAIEVGFDEYIALQEQRSLVPACLRIYLPYFTSYLAWVVAHKLNPSLEIRMIPSSDPRAPWYLTLFRKPGCEVYKVNKFVDSGPFLVERDRFPFFINSSDIELFGSASCKTLNFPSMIKLSSRAHYYDGRNHPKYAINLETFEKSSCIGQALIAQRLSNTSFITTNSAYQLSFLVVILLLTVMQFWRAHVRSAMRSVL